MTLPPLVSNNATTTTIGLTFELGAKRDRVWRAITEETKAWWPKEMLVGGPDSQLVFEVRLGGRLYEQWGQGAGLTWYTVIAIDPKSTLDLAGHVTPRFGGPAISQLHIELADTASGTRISITDGVLGRDRRDTGHRVTEGWSLVFGNNLKKYVEGR
jgi:uncharacterized protein YndB with AHSA1/START domain